ncbi:hypothetical protein AAG906_016770 [Vitis piasezkii]
MDTRGKTNAEFRNDVNEILARHDTSFDQVNAVLQEVLTELQALRASHNQNTSPRDASSHPHTSRSNIISDHPHQHLKLSFPKFNGDDPTGWIYKAEQYFDFKNIAPEQQVHLASFHLEGIALQWHRWLTKFRGPLTWDEFTKVVQLRFGPTDYEDPSEALTRLKQTTSVAAYQEAFEKLSHRRKPNQPTRFQPASLTPKASPNPTAGVLGPPPTQRMNQSSNAQPATFRRITNQEARERREKGLCYYCDEKFVAGHRCERPQLFMIEDFPHMNTEDVEGAHPEQEHHEVIPEISFHAIARTEHPQTIRKFEVMVANREKIECTGQCRGLTLTIQGYSVTADYYILPIAACQLVLGVQWLETLGPIEMDYKQLTMNFKVEGTPQTFQGLRRTNIEAFNQPKSYPPEIGQLLAKFSHVFESPTSLPPRRSHDHQIPLQPSAGPVSVRPYRYPYYQKTEIEKMVKELLQSGLIRPSNSPFSSPVLLVKKADGAWRFCVDYRALNDITVKDKYPIPIIDELLDELHGAKFYSKLDLRSGYHQIRVHEDDIPKTAFRTHEGHYEFIVMPFGLTNAPATFQSLMNDLFHHLAHLQIVLQILSTNSLFAKESKCRFGVLQVEYLGHIISEQGVSVDPAKIQAVIEWPTPTTAKGDGFQWNEAVEMAFTQLKEALTSPPILRLPDFTQRFVIDCDASGIGLGAILTQENRPVAYFSQALKGSALSLSTYEKEMLAIVKAIKLWRPYLLGKPFTVRTDQKSLKYLLEQRITTPAQTRWLPKLLGYDYEIEYKRGPENQGADSLSRVVEFQFLSISQPRANWWPVLQKEVQQDSFYEDLLQKNPSPTAHKLLQRDGVWFKGNKVYLSPNSSLISKIMADCHSSPIGGHFGFHKTLSRIKQSFFWSNMRRRVKDFLQQCDISGGVASAATVPTQMWTDVSMDFIEGLPSSNGYTSIMVVVDRLTKYAHFVALKHPFTAVIVAKAFVANVVRLHGIPTSIVSDRDKVFISSFWRALFQLQGTKLCMSSSYHPQSDGQTEVVNRTLEQYLRCFAGDQPRNYNTSTHSSTKMTPFEAVYGITPPRLLAYVPVLRDRDAILRELRHNLLLAQDRMKCQADQHRREASFLVGDYVYLKLQPYRQTSVAFRSSMKLAPRFFGPYKVIAKVGPVAYKLALPLGSQIHDVFHVSLLKKHLGPVTATSTQLPPVSDTSTVLPQPEAVLDRRVIHKGKYRPKSEILVKWVGVPAEDATWENEWRFTKSYPDFILVDKDS